MTTGNANKRTAGITVLSETSKNDYIYIPFFFNFKLIFFFYLIFLMLSKLSLSKHPQYNLYFR